VGPRPKGLPSRIAVFSPLHHYHYDVFESPTNSTGAVDIGKLRFLTNMSGNIDGIAAPLQPEAPEIVFTRIPEKTSQQQK
jgi:hypothetical protein